MKIALIGAFPPQQKGEAHYLGQYAAELRQYVGADALAVVSQYEQTPSDDSWNGFSVKRRVKDRSKTLPSLAPQTELVDAVLQTSATVAHLHYGPNADYGGRLGEPLVGALRRLRARGIPTVITLHSLWLPQDVEASPAAAKLPKPLRRLAVLYFGAFVRRLTDAAAKTLCLVTNERSPMTAAFASAYGLATLDEEVYGLSPRPLPLPAGPDPLVLAFGFFRPDKGFDVLIQAFSRYLKRGGRGRLLVAGRPQTAADAAYADLLLRLAAAANDDRCAVEPRYIEEEELQRLLAAASLVVLPYRRNVGASGPLHQAIACGRPVVGTSAGHGAALTGVIDVVPPDDPAALEKSIAEALSSESSLRMRAEKVVRFAQERSWEQLVRRNAAVYRQAALQVARDA